MFRRASINGALVSGLMTPGLTSQFTHPPTIKMSSAKLGEYIIDVDIERGESLDINSLDELAARVKRMSELQTGAFEYLLDKKS